MSTIDCGHCRERLDACLDGELDVLRARELEAHLADCPACSAELARQQALRERLRDDMPYHRAPAAFRASLQQKLLLADAAPPEPRGRINPAMQWLLPLAAGIIMAVGTFWVVDSRRSEQQLTDEVAAAHLRSLMVAHLEDVESTDQHTVKPWFAGKVEYSPEVHDFSPQGFPLAGGRLDYLDHQKVAALIYRHRLHVINVFVWPGPGPTDSAIARGATDGLNLVHWRRDGMNYWAVSDLNGDELVQLAELIEGAVQ